MLIIGSNKLGNGFLERGRCTREIEKALKNDQYLLYGKLVKSLLPVYVTAGNVNCDVEVGRKVFR